MVDGQIAKIKGIEYSWMAEEYCIVVQSVEPKESFSHGGKNYGLRYECMINKFTFTNNPANVRESLGLTKREYKEWMQRLIAANASPESQPSSPLANHPATSPPSQK